jgi:FKBP12-rapamycin complex-associated protein
MLDTLLPLHAELAKGPSTLREASFDHAFGRELAQARAHLEAYLAIMGRANLSIPTFGPPPAMPGANNNNGNNGRGGNNGNNNNRGGQGNGGGNGGNSSVGGGGGGGELGDAAAAEAAAKAEASASLDHAWDIYYTVFRKINKQLPQLTTLELQHVSTYLLNANRLALAVPGTYRVSRAATTSNRSSSGYGGGGSKVGHGSTSSSSTSTAVRIQGFGPTVQVITSKQRPRKLTIHGEDGHPYVFLLKGHEDLRQDERAMQLFGLVNALLESDRRTEQHDLAIQRYAITPLSHNAGVVGWVPNTDTFHALIRDTRDSRKILLNIEQRLMVQMAPDYEQLTAIQKLEVFEAALEKTGGEDLARVLWLKSANSEQWLERRTCYTRSLAVMSMVGYILGLGDRHPSNLMLERNTGKVGLVGWLCCVDVEVTVGWVCIFFKKFFFVGGNGNGSDLDGS